MRTLLHFAGILATAFFLPQPPVYSGEANQTQTLSVARQLREIKASPATAVPLPESFEAWWTAKIDDPMRMADTVTVSVNSLLISALRNSEQINTFREVPLIRETVITEAAAAFDWTAYAESFWNDTNEPVGSTLTTGGTGFFDDHKWTAAAGLRRKNLVGGQLDIAQNLGHQNNNSTFFLPNNQGTAQLTLSYTQPLMRGRGTVYNNGMTVLARTDAAIAYDELSRQLQAHLLDVTRAYWSLYNERAVLLQRLALFQKTQDVVDSLEARRGIDVYRSQIVRARAAMTDRRSQLLRSEAAVKNAEARIRMLVNDPSLGRVKQAELVPSEIPTHHYLPLQLEDALALGLRHRPEIHAAMKQIKAACVRHQMARHELMPVLNLVAESYLSGLRGNSDIGRAWADQYSEGRPSYTIGLRYEIPLYNRAARARLERRHYESRQLQSRLKQQTETVHMEVEVALREVQTSFDELAAKYQSMTAAHEELNHIQARWKHATGENGDAGLMLDNLLRTQERVTESENEFLTAQMTYNLGLMNFKRATGTLLQAEKISQSTICECGRKRIVNDMARPDDAVEIQDVPPEGSADDFALDRPGHEKRS